MHSYTTSTRKMDDYKTIGKYKYKNLPISAYFSKNQEDFSYLLKIQQI